MADTLTPGGWMFLVIAWSAILALNVFCFHHIFREKKEEIAEPVSEFENVEKNA